MSDFFTAHQDWLTGAQAAIRARGYWSPFIESPSRKHHPEGARTRGERQFQSLLGRPFPMSMPGERGRVGQEVSPYTQEALGIDYPSVEVDALYDAMRAGLPAFTAAGPTARVGVCLEMLHRWSQRAFENAYATMHTAGQSFMMAFAGSGANSLDRGLEALALAHQAMAEIPARAQFQRRFGPGPEVHLDKRYRLHPRGIAVVFACGTYPAWNAYPAILANLATGNPVVVKPHPACILPMARAVQVGRRVLADAGFDENLLTLAADTRSEPIGKVLLAHPKTAIVDFTGGAVFGQWIEESCRHAQVYTETAGCNAVVLESARDLDAALHAIAHGICIFSSQMCTAPQNIFVPADGVRDGAAMVPVHEVEARLSQAIATLTETPQKAAPLCAAIMSEGTLEEMSALGERGRVLHAPQPFEHPEFPRARTTTPLLLGVGVEAQAVYSREHFGPMAFVIRCEDREHALAQASLGAAQHGAIASYAYSTDPGFIEDIEEAFAAAGASVGINLLRQLPINYAAAYSDFHVTGLNPAGNACLADLAFVAGRFRITQSKIERG